MKRSPTDCPKCGCVQSYRAMVDGKPMRQCHACGHRYEVKKSKPKAEEPAAKEKPKDEEKD